MEYWGAHSYCGSVPPAYTSTSTTAIFKVGDSPATHEFAAHANQCSAATQIKHSSQFQKQKVSVV